MKLKGLMVLSIVFICIFSIRVKAEGLSEVEKGWLMQIAMAEAGGESTEGKAAVMRVVLNRVADPRFPNTIPEVLFAQGQFTCVKPGGRIYTVHPNDDCVLALAAVEAGWDGVNGALYFNSCNKKSGTFVTQIGNHKFYK